MSIRNAGPVANYERLTGRPPTPEQSRRLERIRIALQLRDDDAMWALLFTLEEYFGVFSDLPKRYAEAGRVQAEALTEQVTKSSDLRQVLGEPIMKRILVVSVLVAVTLSFIGIITVAHFSAAANATAAEWAHEYVDLESQKLHGDFRRAVDEQTSEQIKPLQKVKKLLNDPDADALIRVVTSLTNDERSQLLRDPSQFESTLKALATLPPQERTFLLKAAKPSRTTMQVSRWVARSLISGDPSIARMLAAYAARNAKLNKFIAALPVSCSLAHYEVCR